jgi:hypothetical protein
MDCVLLRVKIPCISIGGFGFSLCQNEFENSILLYSKSQKNKALCRNLSSRNQKKYVISPNYTRNV